MQNLFPLNVYLISKELLKFNSGFRKYWLKLDNNLMFQSIRVT
jgi:hypothetical protein